MSALDTKWHRLVCEAAGYICHICQKDFSSGCFFNEKGVNQYVCGHHLETKKASPELRHDTENGICVCDKCHKEVHAMGNQILENPDKINELILEGKREKQREVEEMRQRSAKREDQLKKLSIGSNFRPKRSVPSKKRSKFWGATAPPSSLPKNHKKFWGATKPPLEKSKKKSKIKTC